MPRLGKLQNYTKMHTTAHDLTK